MKILLVAVNAKFIHSNPAVHSLKACAGEYAGCVSIAEFTINQQPSFLLREIYKEHPDVIAFSCYIWNFDIIDRIIADLRCLLPDADLWAGGPEVSYHASEIICRWQLRGVMSGAGEGSFYRLAAAYCSGTADSLPDILDEVNTPKIPLAEIPFWHENLQDFAHRIIYYESSRGCPFSCSYCLSSIDKAMELRPAERVCQELDFFLRMRVPQVKFIDRTFNCIKAHALPILSHILAHDNGVTNFHFEIAADLLDEDYFALFKQMRPGAVQLEIGIQSTNRQTLTAIDRTTDFAKAAAAVRQLRAYRNIHIHLDLIAGLPFENLQSFGQSFHDVYELQPHQLQLGFLKVLKGSPMEQRTKDYGLIYTAQPPYEVLSTRWLSYDDVCHLKQIEAVLEIYYNSGQFTHTLEYLRTFFDTPFAMYDALAQWYGRCGLYGIQSSRVRKYEILLEFMDAHIKTLSAGTDFAAAYPKAGMLAEYLTYDLYLREHMKNRPAFALSLQCWKEEIRGLLYEESRTHARFPEYAGYSYRELDKALHVEVFTHIFDQPAAVFFSYQKRDPLTKNCMTAIVKKLHIASAILI